MPSPASLFRQTISYAEYSGMDAYGKLTLGTVTSSAARIQPTSKVISDANGSEIVISRIVYTQAAITMKHRLWLPEDTAGDLDRTRKPVRVDIEIDGHGNEVYRKVFL